MPLSVHALDVGIVVLLLGTDPRTARRIATDGTAQQQSGAGTDGGAVPAAANRRTGHCTHRRTNRSTGHGGLPGGLFSRPPTDLDMGELAAQRIIVTETLQG